MVMRAGTEMGARNIGGRYMTDTEIGGMKGIGKGLALQMPPTIGMCMGTKIITRVETGTSIQRGNRSIFIS